MLRIIFFFEVRNTVIWKRNLPEDIFDAGPLAEEGVDDWGAFGYEGCLAQITQYG